MAYYVWKAFPYTKCLPNTYFLNHYFSAEDRIKTIKEDRFELYERKTLPSKKGDYAFYGECMVLYTANNPVDDYLDPTDRPFGGNYQMSVLFFWEEWGTIHPNGIRFLQTDPLLRITTNEQIAFVCEEVKTRFYNDYYLSEFFQEQTRYKEFGKTFHCLSHLRPEEHSSFIIISLPHTLLKILTIALCEANIVYFGKFDCNHNYKLEEYAKMIRNKHNLFANEALTLFETLLEQIDPSHTLYYL